MLWSKSLCSIFSLILSDFDTFIIYMLRPLKKNINDNSLVMRLPYVFMYVYSRVLQKLQM